MTWGFGAKLEARFPELLQSLEQPQKVPGVYYRNGEQICYSGAPSQVDFPSLKRPRRDLVPHEPYLASSFVSVGVQAKRGCALRCVHCSDTFLLGHHVRMRSPKDVVDEIEELVLDYGVREFFFVTKSSIFRQSQHRYLQGNRCERTGCVGQLGLMSTERHFQMS